MSRKRCGSDEAAVARGFFMPFACIFVPDFPVAAILRVEPDLRAQAVAVLEGKPPVEKICSANEDARRAGITAGMTKLQAELCEQVALRKKSELQESAAHRALLDCAASFSPRVEDAGIDTVLFDVAGLEKLLGPLPKIARQISRRASDLGLQSNVAVASTLEAALLAAHGFSGVSVVPEGKEAEFLGGLSVEVLFADENESSEAGELLETFRRWGIRKCRELATLPEVELTERLGQRGLELQRKARGIGTRTLAPSDPPLIFEEAIELEHPLVLLEPLAFLFGRLLDQLCARLLARALSAQEIHLKLTLENRRLTEYPSPACFERTLRLPVPMLDARTFLKLLQLDLNSHPPGAPVMKVYLRIEPAKPRPAQNGLFIPSSPEPERLELTLARISGVVGERSVGSPALLDTHRREAFEMQHFSPEQANITEPVAPHDLVTALRIFRPPVKVAVTHECGRPSSISLAAANSGERWLPHGEVLWAAGPWRSSGDWWEEDAWIRDEWDIAVQEKSAIVLYRLVHDLIAGVWLLEGTYD